MMNHLCKGAAMLGFKDFCHEEVGRHELYEKFHWHMEQEGLNFGTKEEYMFRFDLFRQKDELINEVNNEQDSYKLGHNMFSTMTEDEAKKMLGGIPSETDMEPTTFDESTLVNGGTDWISKGGVNPVKNQGQCGSCWAFGTTAVTENAHFRATGQLLSLSEQQLVSCSEVNHGCKGGWQDRALQFLQTNAQVTESQYPYTSGHGKTGDCDDTKSENGKVVVSGIMRVTPQNPAQLKAAIDQGVVTVTIEADQSVFQMYHSGIFNNVKCGTKLDHAVAAVGWGTQGGQDYYVVRNSWSSRWGQNGYIKIAAVAGKGICGIQMDSFLANSC